MRAHHPGWLLPRTFFGRFFESELMPPGLPQVQVVIWGVALLTAPGYLRGFLSGIRYDQLWHTDPAALPEAMRTDALFFVTFGMMALGLVALIVWEGVFPDRRDVRTLGVLPLESRTLIVARLSALAAVAALFCVGVNLPSTLVYGPAVGAYEAAAGPLRTAPAHFLVTSMAGLFAFFLVITAQGLLLTLFGRRVAQRLALGLQMLLIVGFLQMFLLLPFLSTAVSSAFRGDGRTWVALLPPAWFLGFYELAAGSARHAPKEYALTAALATGLAMAGATALLAGGHARLIGMALEAPTDRHGRLSYLHARGVRIVAALMPDPVERAIAGFTVRTLVRSRTHMMLLVTYLGVGVALVVSVLLPQFVLQGLAAVESPSVPWLSAPLILTFCGLWGSRTVLAVPADIRANWVFRLHASDSCMRQVVDGTRAALLVAVVLPVALAAGVLGMWLWGLRTGGTYGVVTGALGVLLLEVLLLGFRKVPFACTFYPGRSRARTMWPVYGMAFSVYAFSLAALEAAALERPVLLVPMLGAIAGLVTALRSLRRRDLQLPPGLTYEESDPDGLFQGFRLSEGLAAESAASDITPAEALERDRRTTPDTQQARAGDA